MMEIEKDMEIEDSHIRCKQKTADSEKVLDYDYKKCAGCSICVALCPKKALQEGPLQEIAKGMDAPPVLIDLDACVFCGMCVNLCPVRAFSMKVKERTPSPETASEETPLAGTA
jgi:4Fe-4S ferredoxin